MYEKEQKEGFIEYYLRSKVIASTSLYAILKKTEQFESEANKDVSEFNKDEILKMFKEFKAKSVSSLLNYTVILKDYTRYFNYKLTGTATGGAYEEISKKDVKDLIDKSASFLLSREEVTEIEENLYNASDKALLEALWEGIAGPNMQDITDLSEENVYKDKSIIIVNRKEYPLTDRTYKLLKDAFSETEIMSYGNTMRVIPVKGRGRLYKERANVRDIDSEDVRFRYVYRKIQLFRKQADIPQLTMKNLQASGLLYYLKKGMKESCLDIRGFLKTKSGEELAKRYGFGDFYIENICRKYEEYI